MRIAQLLSTVLRTRPNLLGALGDFRNGLVGWSIVGTGVSSSNERAVWTLTANSVGLFKSILTIGRSYRLTFTITELTQGAFRVFCGGSTAGTIRSAPGTYTETLTCTGDDRVYVYSSGTTTGSVDNVIVQLA